MEIGCYAPFLTCSKLGNKNLAISADLIAPYENAVKNFLEARQEMKKLFEAKGQQLIMG
ncbi:MAG TPA: hypothetical protein VK154_08550 [Chitinophagales bacterium]|nr:hypothetical protein [Chitinophagales bacterium]